MDTKMHPQVKGSQTERSGARSGARSEVRSDSSSGREHHSPLLSGLVPQPVPHLVLSEQGTLMVLSANNTYTMYSEMMNTVREYRAAQENIKATNDKGWMLPEAQARHKLTKQDEQDLIFAITNFLDWHGKPLTVTQLGNVKDCLRNRSSSRSPPPAQLAQPQEVPWSESGKGKGKGKGHPRSVSPGGKGRGHTQAESPSHDTATATGSPPHLQQPLSMTKMKNEMKNEVKKAVVEAMKKDKESNEAMYQRFLAEARAVNAADKEKADKEKEDALTQKIIDKIKAERAMEKVRP